MQTENIAVFIPIIFILVTGLIISTAIYLRSREKQMLIEKGLSPEQIKEFFAEKKNKDPYVMTKIGIVSVFFGIGLGLGIYLQDSTGQEHWVVLFLFTLTGLGFILANLLTRRLEKSAF